MANNMTTTQNGFRVVDVTFKGARKQSAIDAELGQESPVDNNVTVPVSLTPEQVKAFYEAKSDGTHNMNERKLYQQTIKWIDEMLALKKQVIDYQLKEEKLKEQQDDNTIE